MKNSAEYVVIGAGIIGSTIAYYLTKEGINVSLLDQAGFCAGSSGATHTQIAMHTRLPGWNLDLSLKSIEILEELSKELDYSFEYEKTGSIILIDDEKQINWINKRRKMQLSVGLNSYYLTRKNLNRLEPYLSKEILSAIFYPQSIRINSMRLCHSLIYHACQMGADINLHATVRDIVVKDKKIQKVRTTNGDINTNQIINATGAWAPKIGKMVGLEIPININKGQVIITEKLPNLGIKIKGELNLEDEKGLQLRTSKTNTDLEKKYAVRFTISQTVHGNCLIGRSGEDVKNPYDRSINYLTIKAILLRASRFMPILENVKCIRTFAGFRPYSPDKKPLLGPSCKVKGFIVAAGHGDKGIGWMSTAKILVDHLLGRKSFMSIKPFSFDRIEIN